MMRSFIIALSLATNLFSLSSFAFPANGDFAQYTAKYEGFPVVMEKRVLAHDGDSDQFVVRTLTTYRDRVLQDQTVTLPRSFLYSLDKIKDVIQHCVAREGAVQVVQVLGAKMEICEFYNEDSQLTNILGPVPFGQIRFQTYIGGEDFLDFNLSAFTQGSEGMSKIPANKQN